MIVCERKLMKVFLAVSRCNLVGDKFMLLRKALDTWHFLL